MHVTIIIVIFISFIITIITYFLDLLAEVARALILVSNFVESLVDTRLLTNSIGPFSAIEWIISLLYQVRVASVIREDVDRSNVPPRFLLRPN